MCLLKTAVVVMHRGKLHVFSTQKNEPFSMTTNLMDRPEQDLQCLPHDRVLIKLDYTLFAVVDGVGILSNIYDNLMVFKTPSMSLINFVSTRSRIFAHVGGSYENPIYSYST